MVRDAGRSPRTDIMTRNPSRRFLPLWAVVEEVDASRQDSVRGRRQKSLQVTPEAGASAPVCPYSPWGARSVPFSDSGGLHSVNTAASNQRYGAEKFGLTREELGLQFGAPSDGCGSQVEQSLPNRGLCQCQAYTSALRAQLTMGRRQAVIPPCTRDSMCSKQTRCREAGRPHAVTQPSPAAAKSPPRQGQKLAYLKSV